MRSLHINTERGWRGGERQTLWLACTLRDRGHPTWIAARPGEPLAERAGQEGLSVVHSSPRFEGDPVAMIALRRFLRRERITLVHAHSGHAVSLGALATLRTSIPLVVARRVDFDLRDNPGTRWKYGRAAAIIAVSQAVADVLATNGVPRDRVVVVPDGTLQSRAIDPTPRSALAALGIPDDAFIVAQVAQLVEHKQPITFVRAAEVARRRSPRVHALVIGDGPLRPAVEQEIEQRTLGGFVHVLGYRNDADALIAAADVVTLTSSKEGMGSVLLDALLLGKPVVATRAGGIPEIVAHGETGFLAAIGDAAALGDAIGDIATDPALAARLAAGARRRAPLFSVGEMTTRTLDVYERVLSSH